MVLVAFLDIQKVINRHKTLVLFLQIHGVHPFGGQSALLGRLLQTHLRTLHEVRKGFVGLRLDVGTVVLLPPVFAVVDALDKLTSPAQLLVLFHGVTEQLQWSLSSVCPRHVLLRSVRMIRQAKCLRTIGPVLQSM